jgi:CelD/BcsL family acetyltransferase involved in cellulose biosynthesis
MLFADVRDQTGVPLLLLALAIESRGPFRVLCFADFGVADYNMPVLFPTVLQWTTPLALKLWAQVRAALPRHDLVELNKMPAKVGELVNPLSLLGSEPELESGHGNDLKLGRDLVMARQNQLKTTLRNIRKLKREHRVELRFAQTESERGHFIAEALKQKQRRFDQTHLEGFHAQPEKKLFFELGTETLTAAGVLRFCALTIDDNIVATSWNLVHGDRFLAMMLTHDDQDWERIGPSRILNYLLLDQLLETSFAYYDMGHGDEPYKLQQCETTFPLMRVLQPVNARGTLYLSAARFRERLRSTDQWQKLKRLKWSLKNWLRG